MQLSRRIVKSAGLDRHLGDEQAAVLRVVGAAEIVLQLVRQLGNLGRIGLTARVQRGFQQLLINHRGTLGLVGLVFLPALPAKHSHQRQYAAGQQRFAVALPPVLDYRQLFIIGTRNHPNTPIR
ncbi:hypothetical protein D9M68_912820 [compost metagenome]